MEPFLRQPRDEFSQQVRPLQKPRLLSSLEVTPVLPDGGRQVSLRFPRVSRRPGRCASTARMVARCFFSPSGVGYSPNMAARRSPPVTRTCFCRRAAARHGSCFRKTEHGDIATSFRDHLYADVEFGEHFGLSEPR